MRTAAQTLVELVAQKSQEDAQLERQILAGIKASESGLTLREITRAITRKAEPLESDIGRVGHAIVRLSGMSKIRSSGRFTERTSVRSYFGKVCYELPGGQLWVEWKPGERYPDAGAPVRILQDHGYEPPRPPASRPPLRLPRNQPPRHTDDDVPMNMF